MVAAATAVAVLLLRFALLVEMGFQHADRFIRVCTIIVQEEMSPFWIGWNWEAMVIMGFDGVQWCSVGFFI